MAGTKTREVIIYFKVKEITGDPEEPTDWLHPHGNDSTQEGVDSDDDPDGDEWNED